MPSNEINEFAKLLVQYVRDRAIRNCDKELSPHAGSPTAKRWKEAIGTNDTEKLVKLVIQDSVDEAIFNLLDAVDNELIHLSFAASNNKAVDLNIDGHSELAGWYTGSEGWIATYSKERFIDDFTDLTDKWSK